MTLLLRQPWFLFIAVSILLVGANLVGYKLASSTAVNEDHHRHEHITGLREGLFVLLALLLGFTIAMVLPRFDQRRGLVDEEAHAIDMTWLRAELLPEGQRDKSMKVIRQYVTVRHDFADQNLGDPGSVTRNIQQTRALQEQLWSQAIEVEKQDQTAVVAAYLRALDEMIGIADKRLSAFESRVPQEVWIIILLIAVFQSFVSGYSLRQRFWLSHIVAPVVIAVVMALIADLDDPRTGLIRTDQGSMNRILNQISSR